MNATKQAKKQGTRPWVIVVLALGFCAWAQPPASLADVFTIDGTAGALYDGQLDGWPFPPPDGVADFGGNPLSVALKAGVLEMRGIAEFPLAPLAGLGSADIVSATLTFNIDDVIGTFGPGADFDGTAAETIVLFSYAGNGAIDLSDFGNVAGAPLAVVDTTPFGVITDATLAVSGPLFFDVDVTNELKDLLDNGDPALGIVLATTDDQTATSLDDLGDGGAGPPGVGGAKLPFLTVVTQTGAPPVFDKKQRACQKQIAKQAAILAQKKHAWLRTCLQRILADTAKGKPLDKAQEKCGKLLDETDPSSKLARAVAKLESKITAKCADTTPADLGFPCSSGAPDFAAVAQCVADAVEDNVERMVAAEYAHACNLIGAVGLQTNFPVLCAGN
ncbi:MAG: hypothetical protein KatS3mg076_2956 [Candidatus Binatia bacterium]|nr:MAG: hypothetical protein KatS3mg076_2956 [Candidatus Binatia bacterium]